MSEQSATPSCASELAAEPKRRVAPRDPTRWRAALLRARAPNNPRTAAIWQRADDWNVYLRLSGGCHAARDTESAIRAAGFGIERCRRFNFKGGPVTAPHIIGLARKH